jgi:phage terminase large subunit-like protein
MRGPVDEIAVAQGCYFDEEAGAYVCDFLESFCRQSKGEWGGQPLELLDWQTDFIYRLYGWKRRDGRRRYRKAYLEIPKKNGKSTLLSGLALYHLVADGEDAPECYLCAVDKAQASIVYDESARMVEASPDLSGRIDQIASKKTLLYPSRNGKIVAQSADVPSKDGLNSSLVIFDELHRQRTPAMWRIYRYSGASRRQPLIVSITHRGARPPFRLLGRAPAFRARERRTGRRHFAPRRHLRAVDRPGLHGPRALARG